MEGTGPGVLLRREMFMEGILTMREKLAYSIEKLAELSTLSVPKIRKDIRNGKLEKARRRALAGSYFETRRYDTCQPTTATLPRTSHDLGAFKFSAPSCYRYASLSEIQKAKKEVKTRKHADANVVIFVTTPCSFGVIPSDRKFAKPQ